MIGVLALERMDTELNKCLRRAAGAVRGWVIRVMGMTVNFTVGGRKASA